MKRTEKFRNKSNKKKRGKKSRAAMDAVLSQQQQQFGYDGSLGLGLEPKALDTEELDSNLKIPISQKL